MIRGKMLARDEIEDIWNIDRSEVIDAVYYLEGGELVLKQERYALHGWPAGESEMYRPILEACHDAGGWFHGLFDNDRLIGIAVLENRFMGKAGDTLQLKFLHVSRAYRDQGLGRRLFDLAAGEARRRGARRMYISATPSEHTIGFYLRRDCKVTLDPDPELFALEPEDIHLECEL